MKTQNEMETIAEDTMRRYLKRWWSHVICFNDNDAVNAVLHSLAFPDDRECNLKWDDTYYLYDENHIFVEYVVSLSRVIDRIPFLEWMEPEQLAYELMKTGLAYDKNAMITTGVCLAPKYMNEYLMSIRVWLD